MLLKPLSGVEPSTCADVRRNDVGVQAAESLRVNDIEPTAEGLRRRQKSQNRSKCRESQGGQMVKMNCTVVFKRKCVREDVDFVSTAKSFCQFNNVPAVTTGSVIVVNHKRDLHFKCMAASSSLVKSATWLSILKEPAVARAPFRNSK